MVNVIALAVGAIGVVLLLSNVGKIRDLIPTTEDETSKEEDSSDVVNDLPSQDDDKGEKQIIVILKGGEEIESGFKGKTADDVFKTESKKFFVPEISFIEARELDKEAREEFRKTTELGIADEDKFSTSLADSKFVFGAQFKRDPSFEGESITDFKVTDASSTFQNTLKREQDRAARLFQQLFGSIQNPNF